MDGDALTQGGEQVPPPPGLDYQASPPNALSTSQAGQQVPPPPGLEEPEQPQTQQPPPSAESSGPPQQPSALASAWDIGSRGAGALLGPAVMYGKGAIDYGLGRDTAEAATVTGAKNTLTGNLLPADQNYETQLQQNHPMAMLAGQIHGFGAMMVPGFGTPGVLANLGLKGRLLWQGVIGGVQGGWLGFANAQPGSTAKERGTDALVGAGIGSVLGIVGSAIGEGVGWGVNKLVGPKVSGAAAKALEETGLSPFQEAGEQQEGIRAAASNIASPTPSPYAEQGLEGSVNKTVTEHAQQMYNDAIELLRSSASKDVMLSADGVGGLAQKGMERMWNEARIPISDLPKYPQGQKAFQELGDLAQRAFNSHSGQVPLTDLMNATNRINGMWKEGANDPVYHAVRRSLNDWMRSTADAHLMSGDPGALREWAQGKDLLHQWHDFIDAKSALGGYAKKALSGEQMVNWIDGVTKLGQGNKGAQLIDGLKPLLNDQQINTMKATMFSRALNMQPGMRVNPQQAATHIDKLLATPATMKLFTPEETGMMRQLALAYRTIPQNSALISKINNVVEGMIAGSLGAGAGAADYAENRNIWSAAKSAIIGAVASYGAEKLGKQQIPRLLHMLPGMSKLATPLGLGAMYETPTGQGIATVTPQHWRGGAAKRALAVARRH